MAHLGRAGSKGRVKVRSLKQEALESRSTPLGGPILDLPVPEPPEPPQPPGPPDSGDGPLKRTTSPPCYKVNVRLLRHLP